MKKSNNGKSLSRRGMIGAAAAGALPLAAKAQPAQRPAQPQSPLFQNIDAPIASNPIRGLPGQGGRGPIRVLLITAYHQFDRENLFRTLDMFGDDITWTHVEHPAAERFFDPKLAADFDVFLFFDAYAGRKTTVNPDGTRTNGYAAPSQEMQDNLKALLTKGDIGFVMLHHALASWVHTWPAGVNGTNAYVEMMGGAADWGTPLDNIRGVNYPRSGWRHSTEQHITVVDKTHPVMAGVTDFYIIDEPYICPMFEDSVHCLTRTNFVATVENFMDGPAGHNVGAGHPRGSNMASWVKTAENSPLVYIQNGHDNFAWSSPNWRRMVINAIKWTASPAGRAWAKANPKRIFR